MRVTRDLTVVVQCNQEGSDTIKWISTGGEILLEINGQSLCFSVADLPEVEAGLARLTIELDKEKISNG